MKRWFIVLAACGLFAMASPAHAANGTISGTITHAVDATVVTDIYVTIQDVDDSSSVVTVYAGNDGTYSSSVAPGTYTVTNTSLSGDEDNIEFINSTVSVTVGSGETKSGTNLAITRRGRFTGHVYAADGVTPIKGASVSFNNALDSSSGSVFVSTDSSGRYYASPEPDNLSVTAIGTYDATVGKTGYFSAEVPSLALAADETTVTQDIRLTAGSTVSGTITDLAGHPLVGATVRITSDDTYSSNSAQTNSSGVYTVSVFNRNEYNSTAVGDYTLAISKIGYVTHTAPLTIVTETSALTGYDYYLVAAGAISGTVKNTVGSGLAGASISASSPSNNSCFGTTDSSGGYTLVGCQPSTDYILTVSKTSYVAGIMYNVTVTGGSTTSGKNFVLQAGKTYSGRVVGSGGGSLENATVALFRRNAERTDYSDYNTYTRSDGSFSLKGLPPGKYRVKVSKPGYVSTTLESVTITANVTGRKFTLSLGSSITGLVFTGKNSGIPSVAIHLYAINNGKEVSFQNFQSDENGRYLVSGLKTGKYRLKVVSEDYVTRIINVTIKKANTKTTSNIKLTAAGSVSGYITDRTTGLPVSVLVRVAGTAITTTSDSNGYYVIDGIAPGKHNIIVSDADYETASKKNVSVSAGKMKTDVNITIVPKQ